MASSTCWAAFGARTLGFTLGFGAGGGGFGVGAAERVSKAMSSAVDVPLKYLSILSANAFLSAGVFAPLPTSSAAATMGFGGGSGGFGGGFGTTGGGVTGVGFVTEGGVVPTGCV